MAAYTNEASLLKRLSAARLLELQDRDEDGVADAGVLDAAIARAGRIIRLHLRQRYGSSVDSIAEITDSPATPGEVQEVADDLTLWDLYAYWNPDGLDAVHHRTVGMEALEGLRLGDLDFDIDRAAAHEGSVIAVYDAEDPSFAGLDSSDVSRTKGI